MAENRLCLKYPVLVEGKYDKIRLSNIISSPVIALGGFSVFNDSEKLALIRQMSLKKCIIILTDSDSAGMIIRNKLKGMVEKDKLINVYVPRIKGREKRKNRDSKEGILGVEGIEDSIIRSLLQRFCTDCPDTAQMGAQITKAEFFSDGFSGRNDASGNRRMLANHWN